MVQPFKNLLYLSIDCITNKLTNLSYLKRLGSELQSIAIDQLILAKNIIFKQFISYFQEENRIAE